MIPTGVPGDSSLPAKGLLTINTVEDREGTREFLSPLCLELTRALLHQSYYPPDHPRARQVSAEPFALLKDLGRRWYSFTFARNGMDGSNKGVSLGGVFADPESVEWIISGTAGEHFANKLYDFCDRNRIVSFTIQNHITETEFRRFVSVFVKANSLDSETPPGGGSSVAREVRFTEQLIEADVYAVSVVLEGDMVASRARLPWRVRLALSRLRKDLSVLPLYSEASEAKLRDAKMRTLRDVLRPLVGGPYLLDFFLNLDLLAREIVGLPDDVELELMRSLPTSALPELAGILLASLDAEPVGVDKLRPRTAEDAGIKRQLRAIGLCLCEADCDLDLHADSLLHEHVDLVRDLYASGYLDFEALPESMRQEMKADRLLGWYREDPDGFLAAFDAFKSAAEYERFLQEILTAFPQIIEARAYGPASLIVDTVYEHRKGEHGFAVRRDIVARCLSDLTAPHTVAIMEYMGQADDDRRRHLRRLFLAVGRGSIPMIIEILSAAREPAICEDACLALTGLGHAGAAIVRTSIVAGDLKPHVLVHLFNVLDQLRDRAAVRIIQRFLRHPAAEVRGAAIAALAGIVEDESVHWLQAGLADPDPIVSRDALRLLVRVSEHGPELAASLLTLVPPCGKTDQNYRSREASTLEALNALVLCGNVTIGTGRTVEDTLLARLGIRDQPRAFGLFRRRRKQRDDVIRVAICKTLSILGDAKTEKRFIRFHYEPSALVAPAMKTGLEQLQCRLKRSA
jgi:hypothetical protein